MVRVVSFLERSLSVILMGVPGVEIGLVISWRDEREKKGVEE